jgi:hypothetical protein
LKRHLPLVWVVVTALAGLFCARLDQPELISPSQGEILLSANPEFVWHPVPNARSYAVEISPQSGSSESTDTIIYSDTSFLLGDTLKLGQEYHWRVTARNLQGDESDPSQTWSFKVKEGVELVTPGPRDSTAWPVFTWQSYAGADSYRLAVSCYADFREPFLDTSLETSSFTYPDSLYPATYYWRVLAVSGSQAVAPWSVVRRLVGYRLKDTYFPLFLGRKQLYEWAELEGFYLLGDPDEWDTTGWDTTQVSITVKDTFWREGRLFYVLAPGSGKVNDTLPVQLWDVGDTVAICHDTVFSPVYPLGKLYPYHEDVFLGWSDFELEAFLNADTLMMVYEEGYHHYARHDSLKILRLPGQGTVYQQYYWATLVSSDTHDWKITKMVLLP